MVSKVDSNFYKTDDVKLEETQISVILQGFYLIGIDSIIGMVREFNSRYKGKADVYLISTIANQILSEIKN